MEGTSYLLKKTMGAVYTFIIIFGIYIIYNGHISPGGGFQGGAILAAVFIVHYLITEDKSIRLEFLTLLEKILYFAIVCFSIVFVLYNNNKLSMEAKSLYLLLMNILIGIKVCCGLSVVFFRFVLFESR
ncbi:MAG: sodium:proton antiporter [Firmicutes bacterium HGW-Firmicutes-1]|jgi:multicomponent Na+:H+ antiporter subunit B|nr:MAG: sodium:proton antiporter [Firmicutes bacterium HGW-Firmicutes-1]